MITYATNNTNVYNFMLLKTNYIKGENYKIKSMSNVLWTTFHAFVVWFEVLGVFRENVERISIVFHQKIQSELLNNIVSDSNIAFFLVFCDYDQAWKTYQLFTLERNIYAYFVRGT